MKKNIRRKQYIERLEESLWTPFIKIITGQRRVGKSTLLKQIATTLWMEKCIFLDLELYDIQKTFSTADALYTHLTKHISGQISTVCIDEIQHIPHREKVIASFHNSHAHIDFFITGSNSNMLSGELTTLLRGRYTQIHVYPFAYHEFCDYFAYAKEKDSLLKYLHTWWFPSIYPLQDQVQKKQAIMHILDSIILKDVIERHHIKNPETFRELFYYLINVTSSITNIHNIHKHMKKSWYTIAYNTLQSYVSFLQESYLLSWCELYDIWGKRIFDSMKKRYPSDHSLRTYLFSSFDDARWRIIENMIFLEAQKKWYTIHTGKKWDLEIDFIIEKNKEKKYIQVAYLLHTKEVIERETRWLKSIRDSWPKYLISLDEIAFWFSDEGIQHIQARDIDSIL